MAFILKRLPWLLGNGLTKTGRTIAVDTATDTVDGILETATQSEQETGTATDKIVTPGRQHYHPSAAKAWCRIVVTAGTPALSGSYNVTSVTDTGTGQATPVWDTDFDSTSYAVVATIGSGSNRIAVVGSQAVGSATIVCRDDAGTATDPGQYFVIAFGDHA